MLSEAQMTTEEEDEMAELEEYERERQANIRENAELMASLGLEKATPTRGGRSLDKKPSLSSEELRIKREARARAAELKRAVEPTRRSGRVAAIAQKVVLVGDDDSPGPSRGSSPYRPKPVIPKQIAPVIPSGPEYETSGPLPSQPIPSRDEDGVLQFEEPWGGIFTPNVTPEEMFRGGAFGGGYFWYVCTISVLTRSNTTSKILKAPLSASADIAALPFTLPEEMVPTHLSSSDPDGTINRFGVRAGQSLQEWEKAGWIWEEDPRGWAQWYTRFWAGRRTADDRRQITRWLKLAGPTGRFKNALIKQIIRAGGKSSLEEEDVGRVVRQTLWQWGYQLTESEWDKVMGV